uniref:Major facilitator superfamily (MFS) profile domain-containing protein n=1 Tax=Timema genevievae TaxID=629358 RepID=A0A7R9JXQ0_TIMGE|nr:unnamed protein product [Timema genevievae]
MAGTEKTPSAEANKLTRSQWVNLFCIGSVHFACAICVSIQAPFYPKEFRPTQAGQSQVELPLQIIVPTTCSIPDPRCWLLRLPAESKGASATEHGLVFGIFELVSFLISPLLGKYMDKIGPKKVLNTGIFIAGICCMLFGLLDLLTGHTIFITLSFLIRIIESMGASAATVAAFAITAEMFPDKVAVTFLGGYKLPFLVMGGTLALDCLLIYILLPKLGGTADPRPQGKLMAILSVPAVLLDTFSIMSAATSMGFYSATLEPHLRSFDLGPVMLGVMFVLSGAMYTITAPLVGRLCDTRVYPKKFISIGSMLIIISYLLVGPFPYLPLDPAKGFPDDMTTYGIISGLWLSSFSLGAFIGPSIAGLLFDLVKFRKGTLFIITLHFIVLLLSVGFICIEKRPKGEQTETNDNLGEAESMLQLDDRTIVRRKSGVDVEMTTLASNDRKHQSTPASAAE